VDCNRNQQQGIIYIQAYESQTQNKHPEAPACPKRYPQTTPANPMKNKEY
jgi:hypothetical protein